MLRRLTTGGVWGLGLRAAVDKEAAAVGPRLPGVLFFFAPTIRSVLRLLAIYHMKATDAMVKQQPALTASAYPCCSRFRADSLLTINCR